MEWLIENQINLCINSPPLVGPILAMLLRVVIPGGLMEEGEIQKLIQNIFRLMLKGCCGEASVMCIKHI